MQTILILIIVALACLFFFAMSKPDTFKVERKLRIKAPRDKIYPLINDFHEWEKWSPWEGIDPELSRDYSGPKSGVGSVYAWLGNSKVGQGRMEILNVSKDEKIIIKLDFIKPMAAQNITEFTLTQWGDETEVCWNMQGKNTTVSKFFSLVFNMDKMVGGSFEKGLHQMKALAEKG